MNTNNPFVANHSTSYRNTSVWRPNTQEKQAINAVKHDPIVKSTFGMISPELTLADLPNSKSRAASKQAKSRVSRRNSSPPTNLAAIGELPLLPPANTEHTQLANETRKVIKMMKRMSNEQRVSLVGFLETMMATSAKQVDSEDKTISSSSSKKTISSSSHKNKVVDEAAVKVMMEIVTNTDDKVQDLAQTFANSTKATSKNVLVEMFDLFISTLCSLGKALYVAAEFRNLKIFLRVCDYVFYTVSFIYKQITQTTIIGCALCIGSLWLISNSGFPGAKLVVNHIFKFMTSVGKASGRIVASEMSLSIESITGYVQGLASALSKQTVDVMMENITPLFNVSISSIIPQLTDSINESREHLLRAMDGLGATIDVVQAGVNQVKFSILMIGLFMAYLSYNTHVNNRMLKEVRENLLILNATPKQLAINNEY
jgi:hypothetical protein